MGLMDSIFGGGGGDQVTTNEPWEEQQPHLKRGYRAARRGVLDRPKFYYPGSTVGNFSRPTRRGLHAMAGRAMMGNRLNPAAQQQAYDTMGGSYLTGPGMESMRDFVTAGVRPQTESAFATAGRSGSALANQAVGQGVARGMSPFLDAERNRMMQASQMAPGLAQSDYYDIDRLMGAGSMWDQKYQQRLDDDVKRWDFAQNEAGNRTRDYMSMIGGAVPGTQTQSGGGGGTSPFMQMAGLGLAGAGTAGMLGWRPPWLQPG